MINMTKFARGKDKQLIRGMAVPLLSRWVTFIDNVAKNSLFYLIDNL